MVYYVVVVESTDDSWIHKNEIRASFLLPTGSLLYMCNTTFRRFNIKGAILQKAQYGSLVFGSLV